MAALISVSIALNQACNTTDTRLVYRVVCFFRLRSVTTAIHFVTAQWRVKAQSTLAGPVRPFHKKLTGPDGDALKNVC